jgi:GAF domain-containing protein
MRAQFGDWGTRPPATRQALDSTRGFERLVADLVSALMNAAPDALDRHLREGLTRLASRAGVERASLARFSDDGDSLTVTHSSTTPAIPTSLAAGLSWYVGELRRGHCLTMGRVPGDLPMEAAAERETFDAERIRAHLAVPLLRSGRARGVIALATSLHARLWMPEDVERLRVAGEIMMAAVERRESDEAMRRLREELTHLARVVSLGDLTVALTHELNQPLTAIRTNAQAARRLLAGGVLAAELDDAIGDIADDAARAADLIQRLAALFRRGELQRIAVDVNQVVRDFEVVARAEARRHGARLVLRLTPDLPPVRGDRVTAPAGAAEPDPERGRGHGGRHADHARGGSVNLTDGARSDHRVDHRFGASDRRGGVRAALPAVLHDEA